MSDINGLAWGRIGATIQRLAELGATDDQLKGLAMKGIDLTYGDVAEVEASCGTDGEVVPKGEPHEPKRRKPLEVVERMPTSDAIRSTLVKEFEFDVAGTSHLSKTSSKACLSAKPGEVVAFRRNRGNKFDRHATKVMLPRSSQRRSIGFVPATRSKEAADLLESGQDVYGIIVGVGESCKAKSGDYRCVTVALYSGRLGQE
jgi:hypothetical protein